MKELGPDARELIRQVGAADGPGHATRDRIKRSLVAAIAAGATTAGTTGAAAAIGAAAAGKSAATAGMVQIGVWFVAGGLIGAAVMAPVALTSSAPAPSSPASRLRVERPAPARVAEPGPRAEPSPAPVEPVAESAPSNSAAPQKTPNVAPVPSALGQEVQLLKDAQRELSTGNAARSLALLDAHRAQFPRGELRGERMAARVFALCALGRVEEARRDAELFLVFAPDSPLVPRLMGSCALRSADKSSGASR
jgi:hypothetical protein